MHVLIRMGSRQAVSPRCQPVSPRCQQLGKVFIQNLHEQGLQGEHTHTNHMPCALQSSADATLAVATSAVANKLACTQRWARAEFAYLVPAMYVFIDALQRVH